ncbi:OHCU decarboxylase [Pandoraea terrae]|uniref:2-oxo-4-hydroxy-4-carboxy-5-ureidoimidazoline decarboxylase n=1 Tax=Pandoraea terrae TaxID=1537710 RepID=A0A5E4TQW1_9BURK|nr:2-oxo-4-hydroxy-4-carboxy-5-ureidoimidazoline decarboxylase [Pandoraea terrae]VVD89961.1 OHCU decarboxylase [Pandoraea terrae]
MSATYDLAAINTMERNAFTAAFGGIFEHFPEAAEGAWARRPFADMTALHDAMMAVVQRLDEPGRKAFLNGHPPLSGRALRAGTMTTDSTDEQKSAGLDAMSARDEAQLDALNEAYACRHGFPFIICVRHYTREGIFAELNKRLSRSTPQELDEALSQIASITRARLAARVAASTCAA